MSAFLSILRRSAGIPLVLLAGCHAKTAERSPAHAVAPFAALTAQQDPVYKNAVVRFSRHDFPGALAGINALLDKPQYTRDSADHFFLLHQRAICRHAIDPRIAADDRPATPPPAHPTPAPLIIAQADCGPRALLLLCPQLGVHASLDTLRQKAGTTAKGTTMTGLSHAAASLGLQAKGVQVDKQALAQVSLPAIAWYDSNHYVDLLSVSQEKAVIRDPNKPEEEEISTNELLGRSSGILLTLSR